MKVGVLMLVPKNNIKLRSVKRFKVSPKRRFIRGLQLDCYNGYLPMRCSDCRWSKSCWFCGLKTGG